jgi:hypothetical protein
MRESLVTTIPCFDGAYLLSRPMSLAHKKKPRDNGAERGHSKPRCYGWLDFIPFEDAVPPEAFGWPVAAADPGGMELCSLAPVDVSLLLPADVSADMSFSAPEPDGAELCSFAPLEVSAPFWALSAAKAELALTKKAIAATAR